MVAPIDEVTQKLIEISDEFDDNEDFLSTIIESDDADDLLISICMAQAYIAQMITLNQVGEKHLRKSLKSLEKIQEEFESDDD